MSFIKSLADALSYVLSLTDALSTGLYRPGLQRPITGGMYPPLSIAQVSFEHHRSPLGIGETEPRISWRFEGNEQDWEQSSYDIEVIRGPDEGEKSHSVRSSESAFVPWPDEPLSSAEQAKIRVRAHGQEGQSSTPWSDWAAVETGLLAIDDWSGALPIASKHPDKLDEPKRPVHFRKDFSVDSSVKSARLYITGLGLYEAEINGKRVGDHVLAPGWQSFNHRHVYDTYDVTKMLRSGDNAIGVLVGEGWYSGRVAFDNGRNWWGDSIGFRSLLRITLENGKTVEIPSDPNWKASHGPVLLSEIYDGESYDSRLEKDIKGWSSPNFDDSNWSSTRELAPIKGQLTSPDGPPVRVVGKVKPVRFFKSRHTNKPLVDFGQNLVGWLKLTVEGPAGTTITIHHAEVLDDGELALKPLRSAKVVDTIVLHGGGKQTWEPKFTFHGFRYVQLDGWPADTPLDENAITAQVVHSDMEQTGWFKCSHELLSKFHDNVRWSMKGNFLSISTDCPQRDERLGWTGDAHAFGPTANFLYNTAGFWRGWYKDMWSEMQRENSMRVPLFVPTLPLDSKDSPAAVWGDVSVGGAWDLYRAFGDLKMLEDQFTAGQAWIDVGIPRNKDGLWDRGGPQFSDWLDPKSPPEDPGGATTAKYLVADAYLVRMTELLANMSSELGNPGDAENYRAKHTELLKKFQKAWIIDGKMADRTQTAYALGIEFGLFENAEYVTSAAGTLRDIISENDFLVGTGFAGTPALGPALSRIGAQEDFYRMLLQKQVPSWLYQVVQDGTTTWERWDSMLSDGSINTGTMTSFNHYAFGAVADWIHGVIGGLAPAEPGWKVIEVAPVPGGGITHAETKYLSAYGEVAATWWIEREEFHLDLLVPPNSKARVTLPDGSGMKEVGSGHHDFHCPA